MPTNPRSYGFERVSGRRLANRHHPRIPSDAFQEDTWENGNVRVAVFEVERRDQGGEPFAKAWAARYVVNDFGQADFEQVEGPMGPREAREAAKSLMAKGGQSGGLSL